MFLLALLACDRPSDDAAAELRDVRVICDAVDDAFRAQRRVDSTFDESPMMRVRPESAWGTRMVRELMARDPVPPTVLNQLVRRIVETGAHSMWDDCAVVVAAAAATGDLDAMAARADSTNAEKRFRATADGIAGGFSR